MKDQETDIKEVTHKDIDEVEFGKHRSRLGLNLYVNVFVLAVFHLGIQNGVPLFLKFIFLKIKRARSKFGKM